MTLGKLPEVDSAYLAVVYRYFHFGLVLKWTWYNEFGTTSELASYVHVGLPVVVPEEFRYLCSFVNRFGVGLCFEDCKDLAEWLRGLRPEKYGRRVAGEDVRQARACYLFPSRGAPGHPEDEGAQGVAYRKQVGSRGAGGGAGDGQQAGGETTLAALSPQHIRRPISVTNIYFHQTSVMSLARATTMELNRTEEKRICVIGPPPSERGGVARSTLIIIYMFRKILGYNTIFLPIGLLEILRDNIALKLFRLCNVIHLQYPTISLLLLLFTTARRPKIMLTLRGWVIKEMLIYFRSDKKTFRRFFKLVYFMVLWNLYRYLLSRSVIDYITSVSRITAHENGIYDAIIVPNPTLCRSLDDPCKDYSMSHNHNFRVVTYVSIGGGKIDSIPTAVTIVNHLNKLLKQNNLQISAVLEIYGKDIPDNIIQTISRLPFVKYMGYVSDFKDRIRGADLFLMAYTFPELGHATIEAVCSGVTLAKLTADPTEEEIVDGFNGILATSPHELVMKIYNYLLKRDEQKCYIAKNAISTILRKRDPQLISLYWRYLLESLLGHERQKHYGCRWG